MSAVTQLARRYAKNQYGNLIDVEEPKFDKESKSWTAKLRTNYPRFIRDDKNPRDITVRVLPISGIGQIRLSEALEIVKATARDDCIQSLRARLDIWKKRAERIVVEASAYPLARVRGASYILYPITLIIDNLHWKGRNAVIADEELRAQPDYKKLSQYLNLLEGLDIVRRIEGGYTYGDTFAGIEEEARNERQDLHITVLAHVLKNRYSVLKDTFSIPRFETYVHIESCYYTPALEAGKLIYTDFATIEARYKLFYGAISSMRLRSIISELDYVKALVQEDKYVIGRDDLFREMRTLQSHFGDLSSPSAGT